MSCSGCLCLARGALNNSEASRDWTEGGNVVVREGVDDASARMAQWRGRTEEVSDVERSLPMEISSWQVESKMEQGSLAVMARQDGKQETRRLVMSK